MNYNECAAFLELMYNAPIFEPISHQQGNTFNMIVKMDTPERMKTKYCHNITHVPTEHISLCPVDLAKAHDCMIYDTKFKALRI